MGTFTGRPPGAGLTTLARSPNSPPRANLPLCTAFALKRVARMAALPYATLVQGADGNFYGTTGSGGTHDNCLGEGWMVSVQLPCAGEQENTSLKPSFSTRTRHIVSYDASAPQNLMRLLKNSVPPEFFCLSARTGVLTITQGERDDDGSARAHRIAVLLLPLGRSDSRRSLAPAYR